jgi:hypothetical protein
MVETQHSAEALEAIDCTEVPVEAVIGLNQLIAESLVIPLLMVVRSKLASSFPKRPFSKEDHPIETFVLDRPDEPLGVRVQVGGSRWQAHGLDAGFGQQGSKRSRVFRVAIDDQQPVWSKFRNDRCPGWQCVGYAAIR